MKLDLKELISKLTNWIGGFGLHYVNNYGSALKSATSSNMWECPETGFLAIASGTTNGQRAYWYVFADGGACIGVATRVETANYRLGMTIPVLKGVKYYSQYANLSSDSTAYLYRVGGVVRKLLKALKSLTLGRGWAV